MTHHNSEELMMAMPKWGLAAKPLEAGRLGARRSVDRWNGAIAVDHKITMRDGEAVRAGGEVAAGGLSLQALRRQEHYPGENEEQKNEDGRNPQCEVQDQLRTM